MAENGLLSYDDLFDLHDASALEKILKALEAIDKGYHQMTLDVLKYQKQIIQGQENVKRSMAASLFLPNASGMLFSSPFRF